MKIDFRVFSFLTLSEKIRKIFFLLVLLYIFCFRRGVDEWKICLFLLIAFCGCRKSEEEEEILSYWKMMTQNARWFWFHTSLKHILFAMMYQLLPFETIRKSSWKIHSILKARYFCIIRNQWSKNFYWLKLLDPIYVFCGRDANQKPKDKVLNRKRSFDELLCNFAIERSMNCVGKLIYCKLWLNFCWWNFFLFLKVLK